MNEAIFREYDIRGIVGKDLTDKSVKIISHAIVRFLKEKNTPRRIILGRDNRPSSKPFRDIIADTFLEQGYDITDIGEVPTPVMYYALRHFHIKTGIMITGSHNPSDYNGFKVAINDHCIFGKEIKRIFELTKEGIIENNDKTKGELKESDAITPYVEEIASKIRLDDKGRKIKVVTDAGNGMAGSVAPELFRKMGCEVIELFSESDGTYPNHHPDPTRPEEYRTLMETVIKEKADIGLAFDGDADRLGSVDETGRMIFGDEMMILFAREILKKNKGAKICIEVKCSQALVEDVRNNGGVAIMSPTGHSLIEAELEKTGALLAGEMSGHLYFNDEWYGFDDSIYSGARLLRILSKEKKRFSELLDDAPKYLSTPEIRVEVPEEKKFDIVRKMTEFFRERYEVLDIDGVRFMTDNGWGLIRASNTQPALVVRAEAKTEDELDMIKSMIKERLGEEGINIVI